MNFLLTDLRTALRAARRSPGVTLAIIAMLALGTGGVTAVFNPIYSTLFAPLPYPQPEQLVLIGGNIPVYNAFLGRFEYEELERFFSNLTAFSPSPATSVTIPDTGKIRQYDAVAVSKDFFETLGVLPLRGSDFKRGGIPQALVVSNRFWRNELMGAEDVVGKQIQVQAMGSRPCTIIGIMPESFDFPAGADIWLYDGLNARMGGKTTQYLGRLRSGMSIELAAKELRTIEFKSGFGLVGSDGPLLQSLHKVLNGDRRPILLMLGAAAVLFLALVCAGVMNLLITQGARRKSEMALRLILGATRRNLVFQLLRETLPLVVAGALCGLWLSEIATAWLMAQFPALKGGQVVVPAKMAFFAALVLAVTVIGGLTPALYASSVDLNTYLKSGGNARRRLPFSFSLRELLVGVQLSLALALLTGVGLLVSSMMFHVDIPVRWSSRDMAVVKAAFPPTTRSLGASTSTSIPSRETTANYVMFFQELQNRLRTMPEVASVGILKPIPFSADAASAGMRSAAVFKTSGAQENVSVPVIEGYASPEGFEMSGVTLVAGRHFSSADMANEIAFQIELWESAAIGRAGNFSNRAGGVVIVNQSLARQFWPEENAVGKTIYNGLYNAYEVVGVVRDFHQSADNRNFVPAVYYPPDIWRQEQTFIVKLHSGAFMKDFRRRISGFDAGSATVEVRSLGEFVSAAMSNTRMIFQLLGSFALLGIVIAGLGVYATTSLMAASWNREMGIRMAMGAQTWDILRLALWRGTRAIILGLPVGLFLAWILSRTLSSYLFQVRVGDPLAWVISCALLIVIVTVAALIPALRLARINPLDALRNQ